jgi:hypothetical protein
MIVITRSGRSGTSLLARLYQELGFDPTGHWEPGVNAGLEDEEIVGLNNEILAQLGFRLLGSQADVPSPARTLLKPILPAVLRRSLRAAVQERTRRQAHPDHVRWSAAPAVVTDLGPRLVRAAEGRHLVKDPRFCITLPIWLEAGAGISFVVASVRAAVASTASRSAARMSGYENDDLLRCDVVFQLGCLHDALGFYDVPSSIVRFPDWTEDADGLAKALPWPSSVPDGAVQRVLGQLVDRQLVRHPS